MILDFSQNGMNIQFEVNEDKKVLFQAFSVDSYQPEMKTDSRWCPIVELHITGGNQNDHHGARHTGTWGSTNLSYDSHKYYDNEFGKKLEFYLCSSKLNVTVHYQFYTDISAVRAWTTIKNVCDEAVGIEYVSSFSYTGLEDETPLIYLPHNTVYQEVNWRSYTMSELGLDRTCPSVIKRVNMSNTGTWSCKECLPMGAISDKQNTLMWQIENNGSWQWEISVVEEMIYLKLSGPTEQENMWHKELKPGETFESVKACIAVSDSFDGVLEHMTKYRRIIFKNNEANRYLPVIFNDYMNCLWGDPTTEKLLPIIDKAAALGAEYFCVDAGWYADGAWWDMVGEWQPCSWRFPNGIKEVFDHIRKRGMIPGIWLEIEVMGIVCPILNQFEDECFFMRHGKKVIDHGRYQLDFRNQKVRDFAHSVVDRVVNEYGVGYIKMDYNIDAGLGTECHADSFGDGLLQHNRAYLSWIQEVKEKYPNLVLENCSSGGMRMDYAMLSEAQLQSVTDQTNYKYMAVIASNAVTAVLPEQAAIWSYPMANGDENEACFNMINSMLLRVHLSGDVLNISDKKFQDVKQGVEIYKELRSRISEFIPFYPLGLNDYRKEFACVGYKAKDRTYLAIWRMDSKEEQISVPISGVTEAKILYPTDSKCKVRIEEKGLQISLADKYSAVILECIEER